MAHLDGTLWEVIVFHFIGDDVAKQEDIRPIKYDGGTSGKIEIGDNIEKRKVSFHKKKKEFHNQKNCIFANQCTI